MTETQTAVLKINSRDLMFLEQLSRQDTNFITGEDQDARLRLRDKLLEGHYDLSEQQMCLNLTRDELLFLIQVTDESRLCVVRADTETHLALAERLRDTASAVFNLGS